MIEDWRAVVGYEGVYEVSSEGQVRRLAGTPGCLRDRLLRPQLLKVGYLAVNLCRDGIPRLSYVHRLVMGAFLGPGWPGAEVNHKDSNRANPQLTNLEYVTSSQNKRHAVAAGRMPEGESCPWAKLSAAEAQYIRARFRRGVDSPAEWGRRFNCTAANIDAIATGRSWKGLDRARKAVA